MTRGLGSWLVILCTLLCLALPQTSKAVWETLLDGSEFNSQSAFESEWNYNYPWGQTHNGSAKMWQSNETVTAGVLVMPSYPYVDGTYNYSSGTIYSKWQVTVNSTYPTWDVSGDFQCESQRGTWPAFWLTGANGWPPESDIMEFKGSTTCWQNTYDGAWESVGTAVSSPGNWHNYRAVLTMVNATDVRIEYYIDGVLKTTQTGSGFVGQPMWLIIDYQMEGSSGSPGPNYTTYMRGRNVLLKRDSQVTSPPSVPGSVQGSGGNEQVAVNWSASSNVTSYSVKRAASSGGPYVTIANGIISTRYIDTGVVNGTTYYYVVSAVNAAGESANSAEVSATPSYYLNISLPATASSVQSGNEIPYGTDGDLATRWTASSSTYPQWWRVDLGSVQPLTKAVINWYGGLGRSYKYRIETSSDDINYTILVDQTGRTAAGDSTDTFSASARYVQVTVTGVSPSGGYAAFYECQLFNGSSQLPPAAPGGLSATAVSRSQINLAWNASSGATSYNVKRATVSGGPYTTIATGVGTTSYNDTGLSANTAYYYVVSAVNGGGQSANSSQATATTSAGSLAHYWQFDEVGGTTAADSAGTANGTLAAGATWAAGLLNNAVSLNGTSTSYVSLPSGFASALTEYTIAGWFKLNSVSTWTRIFDFGTGTSVNMFLTPSSGSNIRFAITTSGGAGEQRINGTSIPTTGVWHHFAVTFAGSVGILYVDGVEVGRNEFMSLTPASLGNITQNYIGKSQYTADPYLNGLVDDFRIYDYSLSASDISALAAGTPQPPVSPTGLTATGGNAVVGLSWIQSSSSGITGNNVYRSTTGSGGPYNLLANLGATTSYSDTQVVNGSTYFYAVTAVNSSGESALSAYAGATPSAPMPPAAPSNLTATGAKKKVTITWTDNSNNEDGFKIERSTDNVNFTQITTVAPNAVNYANTGLTSGTTYYYRVRAYNTNGDSAYSNTASAMAK